MKLLDLYTSILAAASLRVTEDGCVSRDFLGESSPFLVDGRRLVLPTREHMQKPDTNTRILFHPLNENIMRGPSVVLEAFREALNNRINVSVALLAADLMFYASTREEQKKLSPDQSVFLSKVKDATPELLKKLIKLNDAMPIDQTQNCWVSFFLKRSAVLDGRTYKRGGIISFPLYQELAKGEDKVYGVALNGKERKTLMSLLEYIFPGIEVTNSYSRGSDSDVAPNLDALMQSVMGIGARFNDLVDLFGDKLNCPEDIAFNSEWVETFADLPALVPQIRAIPMQFGNEGAQTATEKSREEAVKTAGGFMNTAPVIPTAPVANPGMAPAPAAATLFNPITPVTAPAAPAAATHSGGGVDFSSLVAANPVLQMQQQQHQLQQQMMMMNQQQMLNPAFHLPAGVRAGTPAYAHTGLQQGFGHSAPFGFTTVGGVRV